MESLDRTVYRPGHTIMFKKMEDRGDFDYGNLIPSFSSADDDREREFRESLERKWLSEDWDNDDDMTEVKPKTTGNLLGAPTDDPINKKESIVAGLKKDESKPVVASTTTPKKKRSNNYLGHDKSNKNVNNNMVRDLTPANATPKNKMTMTAAPKKTATATTKK